MAHGFSIFVVGFFVGGFTVFGVASAFCAIEQFTVVRQTQRHRKDERF